MCESGRFKRERQSRFKRKKRVFSRERERSFRERERKRERARDKLFRDRGVVSRKETSARKADKIDR